MRFDSSLAWKQASSAVSANREALLALAGVFYLLPGLALALLFPAPAPAADLGREEMMAVLSGYYTSILPFVIPMILFQAAGTLALLTLLTDRTRPTVGEAIGLGVKGVLAYVVAQLLLGVGIGLVGGVILAIGAASGIVAISVIGVAIVIALAVYAAIKTSLTGPVIAVEGERNPIEALKRSWRLTRGNSVRIAVFYALVAIAFLIVMVVVAAILGIILALAAGPETIRVADAVVSSALNAVMALYFVAIIAAVHRQLAGPSPDVASATFE